MRGTSYFSKVKAAWKLAWKQISFRYQLILFSAVVLGFAFFFPFFFDFLEARDGAVLSDGFLDLIPARDSSWIVFFFLYSGILLGIRYNLLKPKNFLIGLEIYCMVTLMRITSL